MRAGLGDGGNDYVIPVVAKLRQRMFLHGPLLMEREVDCFLYEKGAEVSWDGEYPHWSSQGYGGGEFGPLCCYARPSAHE